MAVSLNSVISFRPTANYQQIRSSNRILLIKVPTLAYLSGSVGLRKSTQARRLIFDLLAGGDNVVTESTTEKDSTAVEGSSIVHSSATADKVVPASDEVGFAPQVSESSIEDVDSANLNQEEASTASTIKRGPLTARERLRAARVLSRYTDSKPSKPELGSKLLEALRETDKGKRRPGLPEAPTNMLDDSKRGLSKGGWSISLPGGMDVFFIIFSFVFISSVMFATTYIVWKVGAIHFNEY